MLQRPEFQNLEKGLVANQLDFSARILDQTAWGEYYSDGVSLDAAHNLTMAVIQAGPNGALQAAAGPLNSTSAAGMSASFAQMQYSSKSAREQWYSKTSYGQQLIRLWNAVIPPVYI